MLQVDWHRPWTRALQALGEPILARWQGEPLGQDATKLATFSERLPAVLNELRLAHGLLPDFVFVPQSLKPQHVSYEAFIHDTHQIPTRDHVHDFFNALMWLSCPQSKKALNLLQAQDIQREGVSEKRSKLRDALTLFDENILCISCSDEIWRAMCQHEWVTLFWEYKLEWSSVHTLVFGHALLEKLLHPYKAITAHVVRLPVPSRSATSKLPAGLLHPWDSSIAASVLALPQRLETIIKKPYPVLPVMGMPGWWSEPIRRDFFEDPAVFRSKG